MEKAGLCGTKEMNQPWKGTIISMHTLPPAITLPTM